jgi:hypothetical protein
MREYASLYRKPIRIPSARASGFKAKTSNRGTTTQSSRVQLDGNPTAGDRHYRAKATGSVSTNR